MNIHPKDALLQRLFEAAGEPVSGQEFADEFGLSRTAIWKYIKEFEEQGYEIGTVRKKGYYLISSPDLVNEANIRKYLEDTSYGEKIYYYPTCESTQTIAHEFAQQAANDGTIVIAEEQTMGKGRLSRPWNSNAKQGIWMSVILRPQLTPQQAPQLTLVAAVAVTRAIEEVAAVFPQIKWPNDLLVNERKVTGILTELLADPDRVKAVVIGIGINVNQQLEDFPEELQSIATSLRMVSGQEVNRAQLIAKILKNLEQYTKLYESHGFGPIKLLWESYSNTVGKQITAVMLNETIRGKVLGISEEGMLQVQIADGTIRSIYSADIEFS